MYALACYLVALVLAVLAAFGVTFSRVALFPAAFAFFVGAVLLAGYGL